MADFASSYDPRRLAADTTRAALFQDVVRATSRLINDRPVDAEDRVALKRCVDLLSRVASKKVALPSGGVQQLDSTAETLAFLRAARPYAADPESAEYFGQLGKALRDAMKGDKSEGTISAVTQLREVFLLVGQVDLDRSIRAAHEGEAGGLSTLTSASLNL